MEHQIEELIHLSHQTIDLLNRLTHAIGSRDTRLMRKLQELMQQFSTLKGHVPPKTTHMFTVVSLERLRKVDANISNPPGSSGIE
ncbi:hypothetical protein FGIG_11265 [Fasciola gigantica]|uniref:Uncharacterized protein n=1 Tax=Fasciola gigantica TaxID=46835 RepID=A0A504Y2W4_FASGI|nr:hypothetical protein FGIG_11265 [Fasciola gigantica]